MILEDYHIVDFNISTRAQGNLYIFLGYASGSGKTHAMLNAALQQKHAGIDVCIAYVKKFANAGYKDIVDQIEHIPSQSSSTLAVDVDAVIQRHPQIVIIDNFHECNPTGSPYPRRYEEIQAIMNAGIHVYTSLTIYYLESLSDIVRKLTNLQFETTVPDRLIERADKLELVDTPIETVLQRVQNKQVSVSESYYPNDQLFNEQTLTTLRQLALRHTSHWIERHWNRKQSASSTLATYDHLMVCISSSPLSSKLIRTAYQLAQEIKAEWTAIYIDTGRHNEASQNRLVQNMHLVEQLGGKVVTIHGESIAEILIRYAKQHEVTKIVIGYPRQSLWKNIWRKSIIDHIIKHNSDMDIYVISSGQPAEHFANFVSKHRSLQWKNYLLTFVLIVATTLIDIFINPFVFPATIVTLYLLGIAATAVYLGYRPAMIATVLSVLSFVFFFIPASVDTPIENLPYVFLLIGLLMAGTILTRFITHAIERADNAKRHADQMMDLYSLSRDLSTIIDFENIIETIITHVKRTFQAEVCIYLSEENVLEVHQFTSGFPLAHIETQAAHETYRNGQATGYSTSSYSEAQAIYIPLRTPQKKVGVMGVSFTEDHTLSLDQYRLLDAFGNQAALAIKASRLLEQMHLVRLANEREKLQVALLDSVSHDIRTPLVSIMGALSSLRDEGALFDAQMRIELLDDAWSEMERLNRLVENLLEMSRLQSGELTLNRDWHDLDEIIAVARTQLKDRLRDYRIITHIQQDVSLLYVDFTLMVQVIVNLLDNAAKYTSENKMIEICTMTRAEWIVFQVADQGSGIPEIEIPHIFNKFYRASNVTHVNGTGLGLSICAGIVEAHNGNVVAFNRPEGGAIFEVQLPKGKGQQ